MSRQEQFKFLWKSFQIHIKYSSLAHRLSYGSTSYCADSKRITNNVVVSGGFSGLKRDVLVAYSARCSLLNLKLNRRFVWPWKKFRSLGVESHWSLCGCRSPTVSEVQQRWLSVTTALLEKVERKEIEDKVEHKDVVDIWENITVGELAMVTNRSEDDIFKAMLHIPGADMYGASTSPIDDLQIVEEIVKKIGLQYRIISSPEITKEKTDDISDLKPGPLTEATVAPRPWTEGRTSQRETENIFTVPNALCIVRIGMTPVIANMIMHGQYGYAIGLLTVAGITDLLDGWIARVFPGQSSVMGSFLDPLADKILVGTLFLSLTYMDLIPLVLTSLIVGRDVILLAAGFYIRYQSLDPPRTLGRYFNVALPTAQLAPLFISKVNTGLQMCVVGATLASTVITSVDLHPYLQMLWYTTGATTIASAVLYCFAKDTVKLLRETQSKIKSRKQQRNK